MKPIDTYFIYKEKRQVVALYLNYCKYNYVRNKEQQRNKYINKDKWKVWNTGLLLSTKILFHTADVK